MVQNQSDQSLCLSLEYSMTVKLLTEHHLEFLRLKGGCIGSSESTLVKMPHFWKSHVTAHLSNIMLHVLGEIVELNKHGVKSHSIVPPPDDRPPAFCIFEYVYFARPDTILEGKRIFRKF